MAKRCASSRSRARRNSSPVFCRRTSGFFWPGRNTRSGERSISSFLNLPFFRERPGGAGSARDGWSPEGGAWEGAGSARDGWSPEGGALEGAGSACDGRSPEGGALEGEGGSTYGAV